MSNSSASPFDSIRNVMGIGPPITILFLYIFLNYNSNALDEFIQTMIYLSKPLIVTNGQLCATGKTPGVWKQFPKFCKLTLAVLLPITCSESLAYTISTFDCNELNTPGYGDNFVWHGKNMKCFNSQPIYKTVLAIVLYLFGKCLLFVWALADILSIVLCTAMKNMLLVLNNDLEQIYLQKNYGNIVPNLLNYWTPIRLRYIHIVKLFDRMTNFIYPLILSCYWINVYLLIDNVMDFIIILIHYSIMLKSLP